MKVTELEQAAVINQNNIFFWKRITENYFSGKILHPIFFWMKGLWKKTSSYIFLVESILGQKNPFLVESLWTKKLNRFQGLLDVKILSGSYLYKADIPDKAVARFPPT